jgi:CheY-like chemotaxis protein
MIVMSEPLLSGRRMLVVEDEMMLLVMIEDMLSDLGCQSVSVAATVKQALALVSTRPFDIAILDVNLNGEMSFRVADALAALHVPFIFSSGYGADALTEEYRDRPLLRKPYSYHDLEDVLYRVVAKMAPVEEDGSDARTSLR